MTARYFITLTVMFGALTVASTSSRAEDSVDQVAVRQLYATWRTAVAEADIATYVSLLDEDVKLMPPGAADIHGASTYGGFLRLRVAQPVPGGREGREIPAPGRGWLVEALAYRGSRPGC